MEERQKEIKREREEEGEESWRGEIDQEIEEEQESDKERSVSDAFLVCIFQYLEIQKKNIMHLTEVYASLNTSIIHQYKERNTSIQKRNS